MADAQPMGKTRPGGSPALEPAAPTGATVPGSAPGKSSTPRAPGKKTKKSVQSTDGLVATSTAPTTDPGYWTDDTMASAQPMDNTRPGGSGSQSDPAPGGGTTVPGSPPSSP